MAELISTSPASGLTPVEAGGAVLTEAPMGPIWSVAPFGGRTQDASRVLQRAHGVPFPDPGSMHEADAARIVWSGMDQAFLFGVTPSVDLADHAALTDQSDAGAHLILDGPASRDVLARWAPVDLSAKASPPGSARRTLLGHMSALILHPGDDRFEILVFRSMAGTAVHDLTRSMRAIAARHVI